MYCVGLCLFPFRSQFSPSFCLSSPPLQSIRNIPYFLLLVEPQQSEAQLESETQLESWPCRPVKANLVEQFGSGIPPKKRLLGRQSQLSILGIRLVQQGLQEPVLRVKDMLFLTHGGSGPELACKCSPPTGSRESMYSLLPNEELRQILFPTASTNDLASDARLNPILNV